MQKLMKSYYKSSLITSVVLLLIGILLLFKSTDTIIALSYILGSILVIIGIVGIVNFFKESSANIFNDLNIVYGIISIILGILVIMNPTAIATFIPFVVGIGILVNSAIKLTYSMEAKNNGEDIWKSSLILSVISALCGILILFNPFETSLAVFKIIGAFIVVYAILDIVYMIQIKKDFKNAKELLTNNVVIDVKEADIKEKKTEVKKEVIKKAPVKKTTVAKKTTSKTAPAKKAAPVKKVETKKTTTKKANKEVVAKKTTTAKKKTVKKDK